MEDTETTGIGAAAVSLPLVFGGIYTLANHGAMHQAVHENIEPEVFAGFVGWMLWGLEAISAMVAIIAFLGIVLLIAGALLMLAEKTA